MDASKIVLFPSIDAVALRLRGLNKQAQWNREKVAPEHDSMDVRLQVTAGGWFIRFGLSDYDQSHEGFWGASSVPGNGRRFNSRAVARDLIEQAREQEAMQ